MYDLYDSASVCFHLGGTTDVDSGDITPTAVHTARVYIAPTVVSKVMPNASVPFPHAATVPTQPNTLSTGGFASEAKVDGRIFARPKTSLCAQLSVPHGRCRLGECN